MNAGATLTRALVCQVAHHTRALTDAAGGSRERDDDAGTEAACNGERVAGVPASNPRNSHPRGTQSSGSRRAARLLDQFRDARAELDLVDTGARDGARERDERRARLRCASRRPEPRCPEPRDQRDVGKRLDVLDERRCAIEPALERIRRFQLGFAALPERRSEAPSPRRRQTPRQLRSGSTSPGLAAPSARPRARRARSALPRARPDDDLAGADCRRSGDSAIEHEMRHRRRSARSLLLAGSPSVALTTTTGRRRCARRLQASGRPGRRRRPARAGRSTRARGRARCRPVAARRNRDAPAAVRAGCRPAQSRAGVRRPWRVR